MDKKWFKEQFKRVGKPQSALASELNVEPSAISRALSGLRRFKADEVPYIANFFGVTNDEVMAAIHGKASVVGLQKKKTSSEALIIGKIDTSSGAVVEYFDADAEQPIDQAYAIAFKSPKEYESHEFIGLTIAGNNHPAFPAGTDLIFASTDDTELQDGKTYLYEVAVDGTVYHCIGRGVQSPSGGISLVFEGNDRSYREHPVSQMVFSSPSLAVHEKATGSFQTGMPYGKPAAKDGRPLIRLRGILVKSVKNE
jgi:transcriptional regulator with XRE-family HTH domain